MTVSWAQSLLGYAMAEKLAWFPFYAGAWLGSNRVRRLSGDQMAAYVWLLCEQWEHGHLPFDVTMVTPGVPKGISDAAVAFVLTAFFPPDPDTNLRMNPRLQDIRERQLTAYEGKTRGLAKAREVKRGLSQQTCELVSQQTEPPLRLLSFSKLEGIPANVENAAGGYLTDPRTRAARAGGLRSLLQGMTGKPLPPEVVARGLEDMHSAGVEWRPVVLRTWCERAAKEIQGEAGRRAAQDTLEPVLAPLRGLPEGFSEDEP